MQPVLDRTVLESSDKTNPNLTRVLDVNPNFFLAQEVQMPLIYLRGDGRLNNTQSINSSTTFYLLSFLLMPTSSSSFFVRSSSLQGGEPRGRRGDQVDVGQPIAAACPDGVPPGRAGFRSSKAPAGLPVYRASGRVSFDVSCGVSPPASRVHGDVFVCEH